MGSTDTDRRVVQIRNAAAGLEQKRPAYRQILSFYVPLFEVQERNSEQIRTDHPPIPPRRLDIQRQEGFPLLSPADFPLDAAEGEKMLIQVCRLARAAGGELAGAGKSVEDAMASGKVSAGSLLPTVVDPSDSSLARHAESLGIAAKMLAILCYQAIRPSLTAWARRLAVDPGVAPDWEHGICPICGSPPAISLLREEGRRILVCGFCWHEWPHRRTTCPFCQKADRSRQYLYDETEPECRVDFCDACRGYLKTVDTRTADRSIYPPLEALTTLHLDMKAQDMGYGGITEAVG
jgi:FdhE protein